MIKALVLDILNKHINKIQSDVRSPLMLVGSRIESSTTKLNYILHFKIIYLRFIWYFFKS